MTTSTAPRLTTKGVPSIRPDYRYRPQFDANGKRLRRKGGRPMGRMIRLITARDAATGGSRCANPECERPDLTGRKIEVDHVIPGRLDWDRLELEPADLICLCEVCNGTKSGKRLAADVELAYLQEIARRNEAFGITGRKSPEALQAEFPR